MPRYVYLSYVVDECTPTYGNKHKFRVRRITAIEKGAPANNSVIYTTLHIGTHLDLPCHFYSEGQCITDYPAEFFIFKRILLLEVKPRCIVIKEELIDRLENVNNKNEYEMILVKTGSCYERDHEDYWKKNYGFHPEVAYYIRKRFTKVRVFGFDTISVSSLMDRATGREAHRAFLLPDAPILLLEDMDLTSVSSSTRFESILVAPFRVSQGDGLPACVIAKIEE